MDCIDRKEYIDRALRLCGLTESDLNVPKCFAWHSEYSLSNRIIFSEVYDFREFGVYRDWLEGKMRSGKPLITPKYSLSSQALSSELLATIGTFLNDGFTVGPFDRCLAEYILNEIPNLKLGFDAENSDYIYSSEVIAIQSLPTHRKSRQYIRRLERLAGISVHVDRPSDALAAERLTMAWSGSTRINSAADTNEALLAIELFRRSLVHMVSVFIDDDMVGYVIADLSVKGLIVALILKTVEKPYGLTDFCFRELCKVYKGVKFLNTCQDLGIQGLRDKKMRMGPLFLAEKYYLSAET